MRNHSFLLFWKHFIFESTKLKTLLVGGVVLGLFVFSIIGSLEASIRGASNSKSILYNGRVYFSSHWLASFYGFKRSTGINKVYLRRQGIPLVFTFGSGIAHWGEKDIFLHRRTLRANNDLFLSMSDCHGLLSYLKPRRTKRVLKIPHGIKYIMIDPGHGGQDSGTQGYRLREKDVVLRLSSDLFSALSRKGFRVKMTRYKDKKISLKERAFRSYQMGADLFLSIHCNYFKRSSARGFEMYVLNQVEDHRLYKNTLEMVPPHKGHRHFLKNYHHISKDLAHSFVQNLKSKTRLKSRGVKKGKFFVLKNVHCPAILLEMGYLSNRHDANILRDSDELKKIAKVLAETIDKFATYDLQIRD